MGMPGFIHLTCKSSFSLLEGMVPVKKLGKKLGEQGWAAAGVCDLGNLFGAVEVSKALPANKVQPVLGCELPVVGIRDSGFGDGPAARAPVGFLTLLVQSEVGWKNLARLVSESQERKLTAGDAGVELGRVVELSAGLIALSGAYGRGLSALGVKEGRLEAYMAPLLAAFGDRFYVQLERHYRGQEEDGFAEMALREREMERVLRAFAAEKKLPLVATNDVRFLKPADREAFEVLVGIGDSTTMDDPARRRFSANHCLRSEKDMLAAFADLPEACANTVQVALRCAYLIPEVKVKQMFMPKWEFDGDTPVEEVIRREAQAGLVRRLEEYVYPRCDGEEAKAAAKENYEKQLAYELDVIIKMGFPGYFLITSDFIRWAKRNGIPVGPGRGSGAGSLVAWSLEITDLDPLRWELYFERFLNPERVSLPDFDVDFCQDRRDEVIAYTRERFGHDRVAHIITFGTLKARACLRDVGRVLGLPYGFVGQVAALIPDGANPPPIAEVFENDERLRERYDNEEDVKRLVDTALQLEGCYRHASTHAAGVIITDRPIAEVCGLFVDPRSHMPVTQFSMKDVEYAGLVKFDFLGLKTLSVIRAAEVMVRETKQPGFDIMHVDLKDKATFEMLKEGATTGVFQIEGAGMTELTKKMRADDMEALSALIALYRPGPMDLIPQYLRVRLGQEEAQYPHPLLEETLKVTFGIAVYQEQVMQMARVMGGYTLGGADMLRRAMGKKLPEEMAKEKAKFVAGAKEHHGVDEETSTRIFGLMETFAGYGFNKAHSMAYALISYQTAYLKAHYPHEFMAATMTYDRGNHDKLLRYKVELGKMGIALLPPDVNASEVMFAVERLRGSGVAGSQGGEAVRHALAALKGAGEEAMRVLVEERRKNGPFKSVWEVMARVAPSALNRRQLEVLIKGGVFDSLEPRRDWLWANMDTLLAYGGDSAEARESGQGSLFGGGDVSVDAAPYQAACVAGEAWNYLTRLQHEAEAVGFYLSAHPMSAFADELARLASLKGWHDIADFAAGGGGSCRVAGIVHGIREVKTKTGNRMGIVTMSDATGQGEVAFFPETYAACQRLLEGGQPLVVTVKVSQDGERLRISADGARLLEEVLGERRELVITVADPKVMGQVKGLLDGAGKGATRVKLIVASGQGEAVVKLPGTLGVSASMLANLRGLSGVGVR
ncbi:MAG: DNA polymerase III subunit alpha [Proteobacteria bacterium]|nr:DNA polymerase III subunit alpha [Pseudomonadota bacterium]